MTDDFEDSLRETLGAAVPTPPEAPGRAMGARTYARRLRRMHAIITGAAAAVVVAAAIAVPTVLASPEHTAGPSATSTAAPSNTRTPPPANSFTCPRSASTDRPKSTPPDGIVSPGAVLARICPTETRWGAWNAPAEPLTQGVDDLARTLNGLPKTTLGLCPLILPQYAYTLTFQYPDGHIESVYGQWGSCGYISLGSFARASPTTLLRAYLSLLHDQRVAQSPASFFVVPLCPQEGLPEGLSTVLVDHRSPEFTSAYVCRYASVGSSAPTAAGALARRQVQALNADFAMNMTRTDAAPPVTNGCDVTRGPVGTLLLEVADVWGDIVQLSADYCERVFTVVDREATWYWVPSPAVATMLDAAVRPTGQLSGRLQAVGGPAPGRLPNPLSGTVDVQGPERVALNVGKDGTFGGSLPPGRYRVTGHSPSYDGGKAACQPVHPFVTVVAHQTTHVNVLCQER